MPRRANQELEHLEAATALLTRAMRESHAPVDVLGGALEGMVQALAIITRAAQRCAAAGPRNDGVASALSPEDLEQLRDALEREITVCIESLQFHDRLMQQLAEVRSRLASLLRGAVDHAPSSAAETPRAELAGGSVELF
jgi:hypothetical protein